MNSLIPFLPEIYGLLMVMVFFMRSLARPDSRTNHLLAVGLAAVGVVICTATFGRTVDLFGATYRVDLFAQVIKTLLFLGFFLVTLLCRNLADIPEKRHAEFYLLLTTSTLAMMLLVSSIHLITLYVALELSSYSLYILVYLRRGRQKGLEASLKYFIIGALSSAVTLFGFACIYGATHTASISEWGRMLPLHAHDGILLTGVILSLSGFLFKLAVFPFHFWAPDVYEGAANQVAAYIATTSKVAAMAVLLRFVAALAHAGEEMVFYLIVLSIASMTIGNLCAIVQKDLKRMLAFSSIAHAGYALIGISSMNALGQASVVFYALALLAMKFTCFMVVVAVSGDGRNIELRHLAGLHQRAPVLALALLLALFGLAGIPPTIGFTGKLMMFFAAMQAGRFYLVLIAMINVVISLYYYLQILKAAYFLDPEQGQEPLPLSGSLKITSVFLIIVMVGGGLYPRLVIDLAMRAVSTLH
ncbi:MAG: NADH-quinone oxidoreductase subunit N [Deltaproteobacteria bacterium]|nr:NADH-quinone oxidoreductase subunit N [Deltaproteobacteria bacterium]